MKKRRRYRLNRYSTDTSKLDIFLDVLMNAVGIFMLIAIVLTLEATLAQRLVLQVSRPPKEDKKPYFFEIRGEEIIDLTETRELVQEKVDELYVSQAACFLETALDYQTCLNEVIRQFATFQLETTYYQVRVDWEEGNFLYEPIEEKISSAEEDLQKVSLLPDESSSQLNRYLENIDSEQYYLAFITRPNGFSTYRKVREVALENNFEVGWEPYPYNQPLIFSVSGEGRAIGVQ